MQTSLAIGSIILLLHLLADIPPGILIILLFTIPASIYLLYKTTPDINRRYSLPWAIAAHILSYILTANFITGPVIGLLLLLIAAILHLFGITFTDTKEYLFRDYL